MIKHIIRIMTFVNILILSFFANHAFAKSIIAQNLPPKTPQEIPTTTLPSRIEQSIKPETPKKAVDPNFIIEDIYKEDEFDASSDFEKEDDEKDDEDEKDKDDKTSKKEEKDKSARTIKFKLTEIIIEGVNVIPLDELKTVYLKFIGKYITLNELKDIAQTIENYYRSKGYLLARVLIPPQKIKKNQGKIKFKVFEGKISKVNFIGDAGRSTKTLKKYFAPIENAKAITNKLLERTLLLANDIPGIRAKAIIAPSKTVKGAADLNVKIEKRNISAFLILDNRGTKYIGNKQLRIGANAFGNLTADNLYLDFTTSVPRNSEMRSVTGLYKILFGDEGTSASFLAKKTTTKPGLELALINLKGQSHRLDFSLSHPFVRTRNKNFFLTGGFYAADSKNTTFARIFYQDKVRAGYLTGNFNKRFPKSIVSGDLKFTKGFDIGSSTKKSDKNKSREEGSSNFLKTNLTLSYERNLVENLSCFLSGTGQYATRPLLAGEEFGFGGEAFGSAYDASEIIGDKGAAGKAELRYNLLPKRSDISYVQFFTAYDYGKTWNYGDTGQDKRQSASSFSIGARIELLKNVQGSLEITQPLTKKTAADDCKKIRYFAKIIAKF